MPTYSSPTTIPELRIGSEKSESFVGIIGEMTPINLAESTENILVTLPSNPKFADRFGIFVSSEHADAGGVSIFSSLPFFGVELAGGSINGNSYTHNATKTGGANQYSLWLRGESLILMWVGDTWITATDSRIKHRTQVAKDANQTIANVTITVVEYATVLDNVGGLFNTPDKLYVKRAGSYFVGANVLWASNFTGQRYVTVTKSGVGAFTDRKTAIDATENTIGRAIVANAGDYFDLRVLQDSGANLDLDIAQNGLGILEL